MTSQAASATLIGKPESLERMVLYILCLWVHCEVCSCGLRGGSDDLRLVIYQTLSSECHSRGCAVGKMLVRLRRYLPGFGESTGGEG